MFISGAAELSAGRAGVSEKEASRSEACLHLREFGQDVTASKECARTVAEAASNGDNGVHP
jgi:hypothetical protein